MRLFRKTKKLILIILGILVCFNIIAWIAVYNLSRPQALEVVFFDIGQGDSIFIEVPNGNQILIDGGPDSTVLEKLADEMPFYDRSIDLIILTHPEHDHFRGLFEILKRYDVDYILWTGIVRDTNEWKEWVRLIEEEGADIKIAEKGQRIILSENPFIFIDILHPFENLAGQKFKRANETSIVSHLFFDNVSFLFTGDITKKIELKLIEPGEDLNSEVLKVAHHGSKTSSGQEFLKAVGPELAVIQVGENNYGHPHPEVLARLEEFGIEVLRTDKDGNIKIVSDGDNLIIDVD